MNSFIDTYGEVSYTPINKVVDYSLVLPAFNEGCRLRRPDLDKKPGDTFRYTLDVYLQYLDKYFNDSEYQVCVGDDGSTDNTTEIAQQEFNLQVISHDDKLNHGRGAILKKAFQQLSPSSNIIAFTDADGSYSPDAALRQYEAVKNGADIVTAKRPNDVSQHQSNIRRLGHGAMYCLCEMIAPTQISDPQAGLQTFSKDAVGNLWPKVKSEDWAANREVIYLSRRQLKPNNAPYVVIEQESSIAPRGDSSVRLVHDALEMLTDSLKMRLG